MRFKLVSVFCLVLLVSSVAVYAADNDNWTQANQTDVAADGAWEEWCEHWKDCNEEPTQMVLTPGADATQLNFAWYTKSSDRQMKLLFGKKSNLDEAHKVQVISKKATKGYQYNQASVSNLEPNQVYYYRYTVNDKWSKVYQIRTKDTSKFQVAFVGDPQIGSSFNNVPKDETKAQGQNRAVCNDSFNWNTTLEKINENTTNLAFIVTAGDQIQTRNLKDARKHYKEFNKNEAEYAGFFMPELLRTIPIATAIGNHDCMSANYSYHFNNPNDATGYGQTYAGEDYYFVYSDAVFLMLNTNNSDTLEHDQFIKEALSKTKDTTWRIVVMHQDIFGSGEHSSDEDILSLRTNMLPVLRKYDVDLVLSGHDHTYSRAYINDNEDTSVAVASFTNQEEVSSQVNKKRNRYNQSYWLLSRARYLRLCKDINDRLEHMMLYNHNSGLMTREYNQLFQRYKKTYCNTVHYSSNNGIVFLTANSSSGSKYYKLQKEQQAYIAERSQMNEPSYSIIDISKKEIVINTWLTLEPKRMDKTVVITK